MRTCRHDSACVKRFPRRLALALVYIELVSTTFVTDNFRWQEFACHDGTQVPFALQPMTRRLCERVLEPLRTHFAGPLVVVSGYRTEQYNRRVGGALLSRHVQGDAADIRPVDLGDLPRLKSTVEWMLEHGFLTALGGYGVYPGWIHVDCRPRGPYGHVARWGGAGVGSEVAE